ILGAAYLNLEQRTRQGDKAFAQSLRAFTSFVRRLAVPAVATSLVVVLGAIAVAIGGRSTPFAADVEVSVMWLALFSLCALIFTRMCLEAVSGVQRGIGKSRGARPGSCCI